MQVHIESRALHAATLRDLAQRRVRFVMRRLAWLVPSAKVQLSDVNGPRGGVDKRCQVELQPLGLPPIVTTCVAADWRQALDQALKRAARTLMRQWHRHQAVPRGERSALSFER